MMDVRERPFPEGFRLEHAGRTLAGARLETAVAAAARALLDAGVQRHEPVALHAAESIEAIVALLALRRAGATSVLLHPRLLPAEGRALAARAGVRRVIEAAGLPDVEGRWSLPPAEGDLRPLPCQYVLFTSGTEGRPKGVLLGEGGFRAHGLAVQRFLGLREGDRWLLSLGLAHVGGLAMLLRALQLGCALVLPTDPRELDREVREGRISHASLVPTQFARWRAQAKGPPATLQCVLLGGAPADPSLLEAARSDGWPVRATYGLTEASSQVATQAMDDPPGCVGRPLAGVSVTVEDDAGRPLPPGSTGRITIRGPSLALGYVGRAPFGGVLRTDDLGRLDAEGRLWVAGRRDDVIITGGENVDPAEVEAVLARHPAVAESCVVGAADADWGQAVVAAVVLREGASLDPASLREHCNASLARFKVPKRFEAMREIPRTPSGKMQRSAVRAQITRRA